MPSEEPLSIVIVHSKFDTPFAMTWAAVVSTRALKLSCSSSSASTSFSRVRSEVVVATCSSSTATRLSNSSFSRRIAGRRTSVEKKLPIGSVTFDTASCSGAITAMAVSPAAASAPESPWR